MARIGNYEYTTTKMNTLIKAVELLVKTFKGEAKEDKVFAEALGHKSINSGAYQYKMADLRKYGFLDKKGLIATPRAKKIVDPIKQTDRDDELEKAVLEVSLWKQLRERLGTKNPALEEFKIHLVEITGERDIVVNYGDKIRSLYLDAMSYVKKNLEAKTDFMDKARVEEAQTEDVPYPQSKIKTREVITYKEIRIEYPKDDILAIDRAIQLLEMAKEDLQKRD